MEESGDEGVAVRMVPGIPASRTHCKILLCDAQRISASESEYCLCVL